MTTYINSDNGVVSGVAGLKYSADSSGVLVLQTNTTNALTLDSTQNATFATGILATNPFAGSFSDGTVIDYTTGLGRITVGAADGIAFYNNGIASRVEMGRFSAAGIFTTVNDALVNGLTVGKGGGAVGTNTAIGANALTSNSTGARATVLGSSAAYFSTNGILTAIGANSLFSNTTGTYNTAIGGGDGSAFATMQSNTTGSYNTAVGHLSLGSNTTASNNTAVGYQAGYSNTTGIIDAFGSAALYANTTGLYNSAFGTNSLTANTTGTRNSAFGRSALGGTTTGAGNSGFGTGSLQSNTTGNYNTSVGDGALVSNTTASNNTAVGYQAAYANTTGDALTAVGWRASNSNTTGVANSSLGYSALQNNTTGGANSAFGFQALVSNTTASGNTAVGYRAGYTVTTGTANTYVGTSAGQNHTGSYSTIVGNIAGLNASSGTNTLVGYAAGAQVTTGTANTFIGPGTSNGSGGLITTGSKNTIIGEYSGNQGGLDIRTASNYIVLSDGDGNPRIYNNGATTYFGSPSTTDQVKLQPARATTSNGSYTSGNLILASSFGSDAYVANDVIGGANYGVLQNDSGGSGWQIRTYSGGYAYRFQFNANGAAYNTTGTWGTISDARVKQDVVPANSAWDDIKALAFKKYRLKADVAFEASDENTKGFKAPTLFGLVAQDVQKTSPGLVEETSSDEVEDGKLLAIKTSVLLMKATKALQEAMDRIEALEAKLAAKA